MQNSTTPNSRRRRGRVWLPAQFAAPLEVPGIRKVFSFTEDEPSCAELEYASPGCVFQDISAASSKSEPPCELFSGLQGLKTSRPEVGIHQNSRKCPRCSPWRLRF